MTHLLHLFVINDLHFTRQITRNGKQYDYTRKPDKGAISVNNDPVESGVYKIIFSETLPPPQNDVEENH
jgi:hypothetical protein